MTDFALSRVLVECLELHALDISSCKRITDASFTAIDEYEGALLGLESLNISGCVRITELTLFTLGALSLVNDVKYLIYMTSWPMSKYPLTFVCFAQRASARGCCRLDSE